MAICLNNCAACIGLWLAINSSIDYRADKIESEIKDVKSDIKILNNKIY